MTAESLMAGSQQPVLRFCNVTLGYERHPAVHHLCAVLSSGCMVALVGPNGAGKSTLLKGIVGRLKPLEGHIEIGIDPDEIAYLPQQAAIDTGFPISVWDFAAMGLWREVGAFLCFSRQQRARVDHALAAVGLNGFEQRQIGTLSGGQLQRLLFARLSLQNARLLLLDEPFNGIDQATQTVLLGLLQQWHSQGRSIVAVLHDLDMVSTCFPETLLLARRLIAFGQTSAVLTAQNLQYAQLRAVAFDDEAVVCEGESPC